MISDGFVAFTFNLVGNLAGFYHGIYMFLDEGGTVGNLFDEFQILGRQFCSFLYREEVFHFVDIVYQIRLILSGYGNDVIHRQVTEHAGFNLNFLGIGLPLHFVAGFQFLLRHYAYRLEHTDAFGLQIVVEDEGYTGFAVQTAFFGLGFPFVAVAVTVEVNGLAYPDVFADNVEDSRNLRFTLPDKFVYILLEFYQLLGKSGVQGNHGAGTVGFRTYGTKLEAVARKGKRAGTVTVGVVYH